MKAQAKQPSYSVGPNLQKLFIVVSLLAYALQISQLTYWIVRQFPNNRNLSGFLLFGIETTLLPIVLFIITYASNKTNAPKKIKLFESLFFVSIGLILQSILLQIGNFVSISLVLLRNGYWQYVFYELISTAITVILFIIVLWRIRKHRG